MTKSQLMNYFELFEIPVQLKVDKSLLPRKYFELSKKYHPDYFVRETEDVQSESLERSAQLNRAFKTFQNDDATLKYVLTLKGLLEEEEKYQLPQDFLMEVMDINEAIMDSDQGSDRSGLLLALDKLQNQIYEPVKSIIEDYKEDTSSEEELLQVKEYYYKKKYLDRIRVELS